MPGNDVESTAAGRGSLTSIVRVTASAVYIRPLTKQAGWVIYELPLREGPFRPSFN